MVLCVSSSRISLRLIRSSSTAASFHVSTHLLPSAICSGVQSSNAEDFFMQRILTWSAGSRWGVPATKTISVTRRAVHSQLLQSVRRPCCRSSTHHSEVKARCFAVFASAFGWLACSSAAIRTSNAADFVAGSSPSRQIISANAAIFSSLHPLHRFQGFGNPGRRPRLHLPDARVQQATDRSSPVRNE